MADWLDIWNRGDDARLESFTDRRVAGDCPKGCGDTLVQERKYVYCSDLACTYREAKERTDG